tara:strand:+ start:4394 stop:4786 length:393 start_codon:yes stop_codon:yes gene_type:complete
MRNRKNRRFSRYRSNGRNHHGRINGGEQSRLGSHTFTSERIKNNFKSQQSADKLVDKYNSLAKEALSSGDKILSENYLQHADHFMRIVNFKNLTQTQNKSSETDVDKNKIEETAIKENNSVSNELSEDKK